MVYYLERWFLECSSFVTRRFCSFRVQLASAAYLLTIIELTMWPSVRVCGNQACAQMRAGAFKCKCKRRIKCKCNASESNSSANAQQLNQMQMHLDQMQVHLDQIQMAFRLDQIQMLFYNYVFCVQQVIFC